MDALAILLMLGAGFSGGIVTTVVGGASLICFPAMLAIGLPPVVANASTTVAMTPSNFAGAIADWESAPRWSAGFTAVLVSAAVGSAAGAFLLLTMPPETFTAIVPVLIGFATVIFAGAEHIKRWLLARPRPAAAAEHPVVRSLLLAPVAVYGGYFGAGMSVMLLAMLSSAMPVDYRVINFLKNLLSGLVSIVAVAIFLALDAIAWAPTFTMMAGAVLGGLTGGRAVRFLSTRLLRALVILIGSIITAVSVWKYWI